MTMQNREGALLDTKPRRYFLIQAAFVTAFSYLTSGVYLGGLALSVGASDVLVSYFSVIINICGVLILAFSALLERVASHKRLVIGLTVLSRAATVLLVAVPVWAPQALRLPLLVVAVVVAFALQAQTTVLLNQWMLCFVDSQKSGRYISLRQTLTLVVTVALSLAGGWYMDWMGGAYRGFVVLFAVAGGFGVLDVLWLARIPDSPAQRTQQHPKLGELLGTILRDRSFCRFVLYIFSFYLLLTIADSFTMVYMLKYLALPYQTVTTLYLIISLPQVVFLGVWGKLCDRWGHAAALNLSIWLFAGETLFMAFSSPASWSVFIPIAFLIASFANAGFSVAVFNRRYQLMPQQNRIVYDNFYTAAIGMGFVLGPLVGGGLKGIFQQLAAGQAMGPSGEVRLLYIVSTAGILLLQLLCCKRRPPAPER